MGLSLRLSVDAIPQELQGVMLRMAALIKGRLSDDSDVRPEAFAASFQTSEGEHPQAFLCSNNAESTIHQKDRFER